MPPATAAVVFCQRFVPPARLPLVVDAASSTPRRPIAQPRAVAFGLCLLQIGVDLCLAGLSSIRGQVAALVALELLLLLSALFGIAGAVRCQEVFSLVHWMSSVFLSLVEIAVGVFTLVADFSGVRLALMWPVVVNLAAAGASFVLWLRLNREIELHPLVTPANAADAAEAEAQQRRHREFDDAAAARRKAAGEAPVNADADHDSAASTTSSSSSSSGDAHLCVVCLAAPKNALFTPCHHVAACMPCAKTLSEKRPALCPICRAPVDNVALVYL